MSSEIRLEEDEKIRKKMGRKSDDFELNAKKIGRYRARSEDIELDRNRDFELREIEFGFFLAILVINPKVSTSNLTGFQDPTMSSLRLHGIRRGSSSSAIRRLEAEDDIIMVPDFDYSDLDEKFKLTLVGRMFDREGRSIDALLSQMPKPRIWDVEGRVTRSNLGKRKFQFDFARDEDLENVMFKHSSHFNKWRFSLERWE
ncbi:unnamed protein product [Microthlaspi erraticum]|uniref:DUF4283 domain-containing protein n=1 Tax=Microthlaspi erraticum TaxID=1685480 RepID=A0A6D2HGF1_9BRAS|nr:unnamed protein product [Microthlaspi erraticum]